MTDPKLEQQARELLATEFEQFGMRVSADDVRAGNYRPYSSHDAAIRAIVAALSQQRAVAKPLDDWHEDDGPVVWWKFPVDEPSWIGTPLDSDWPGYHTHWTPHPEMPAAPSPEQEGSTP